MFHYYFLTNQPDIAAYVEQYGATRIFVDLELLGKDSRQGHLDTVISHHRMEDIAPIKAAISTAELLVRLNPLHENTEDEIEKAISAGADIIMQPFFHSVDEVASFGRHINGRARFIPLIETNLSAEAIADIDQLDCVDELYIGLNDLHLDQKRKFMFELVADGSIERLMAKTTKPTGFGGIARVGEGAVSGELVMAEHVRLGSAGVILSRAFHHRSQTLTELIDKVDFPQALQQLNDALEALAAMTAPELESQHQLFVGAVEEIVAGL